MNPLTVWQNMKPMVKMTIVICLTVVVVASMAFGCFDDILEIFK